MRLDDKTCLTTYFNAFYGKMGYQLRAKESRTLMDAFGIAINIENNMRIFGKLGNKRNDPRLFGNRGNKREDIKILEGKKKEESQMDQVLNAMKDLNITLNRNDRVPTVDRPPFQGNFNRKNRL